MIFPQMKAFAPAYAPYLHPCRQRNERKCFLGDFTLCAGICHLLCDSRVSFAKNNNNYSRSFALTCMDALMSWAHGSARATICGK